MFGLIVLVLDVWAIINVVQSNESMMKKAIWVVVILLLPLLGFLLWIIIGPRKGSTA
ncbi:MAG: PLDc N-terminal domain-containing protein [Rhodospirillales bacterium]|nr:PLDc N-terminal domain-containing protein [Rhodospirillales bacterium]